MGSGEALQRAKAQSRKFRAYRERKKLRLVGKTSSRVTDEDLHSHEKGFQEMYRDMFQPGATLTEIKRPAPPPPSNVRLYYCRYCRKYQYFTQVQPNVWKCPDCTFTTTRR